MFVELHTVPQPPQLAGSTLVSVQPFAHVTCVPGQGDWQLPPTQLCPVPQTAKQAPQLAGSDVVSRQPLPHALWPCGQGWQAPPLQIAAAPQALPQAPQLAGSALRSVQLPLHSVAVPVHA